MVDTEIIFSLNTWITLTSALVAAATPFYILLWKLKDSLEKTNMHLMEISTIVSHCPICQRIGRKE